MKPRGVIPHGASYFPFPLLHKEGLGEVDFPHSYCQIFQHTIEIAQHSIIRVADDEEIERLEITVSQAIFLHLRTMKVAVAVQLDHQGSFGTVEIDNVRSDAVLPTKLETEKLFCTQFGPEKFLRTRHVGTEPASEAEIVGLPFYRSRHDGRPLLLQSLVIGTKSTTVSCRRGSSPLAVPLLRKEGQGEVEFGLTFLAASSLSSM